MVGFSSYFLIWRDRTRFFSLRSLAPILTLSVSGFVLLVVVGVFIWNIYSSIGDAPWQAYRIITSPIGYSTFVGGIFGFIFAYWCSFLLAPESLKVPHVRRAHGRWGLVLLTILTVTLFAPSIDRLLGRVTSIEAAPIQLSFTPSAGPGGTRDAAVFLKAEGSDSNGKNGETQPSALGRASFYALSAIPDLADKAKSDPYYLALLNNSEYPENPPPIPSILSSTRILTNCLRKKIKETQDPLSLHYNFSEIIHHLQSNKKYFIFLLAKPITANIRNITRPTEYPISKENISRIMSILEEEYGCEAIKNPEFASLYAESNEKPSFTDQLYTKLLVSFALGSAGAHEASIRKLADWIENEAVWNPAPNQPASTPEVQKKKLELEWTRMRAKQYLAIGLSMEGLHAARLELLQDIVLQMESLFEANGNKGFSTYLRDPDLWELDADCGDFSRAIETEPNFAEDGKKSEPDSLPFSSESNLGARLIMSYISHTDLLVEEALTLDYMAPRIIKYARRNTLVPDCLFILGLANREQELELKAKYHYQYASVILYALEYWSDKFAFTRLSETDAYEEALRQLISAEGYLKQFADLREGKDTGAHSQWYREIATSGSSTSYMERRIERLIKRLTNKLGKAEPS